jgi:dipeptidyl aminopeptidase/acylaminoacyl peptidase
VARPGLQTAAYGSWRSELSSERLVRGALGLGQPRLDGGSLYWLEARPEEGGRQCVVRLRGSAIEEVSPPDANVRSQVHEYGGGDYLAAGGRLFFVRFAEPGIQLLDGSGARSVAGSEPGARYADFALSADGIWLVCVEEAPRPEREPANRLVAFHLQDGRRHVVDDSFDFVSSPRFAPGGDRLAYTGWNHPNMPWNGTELRVLAWGARGPAGSSRCVAGGPDESICQPRFSPAGRLTFVSDRSGWWNLSQLDEAGQVCPLLAREAEFGSPQWVFAQSSYDFVAETRILCSYGSGGVQRLAVLDLERGRLRDLAADWTAVDGVRVAGDRACFLGSSASRPRTLCLLSLRDGSVREVRRSSPELLDDAWLSKPEAIEFPSRAGRRAHAFVYRPRNPAFRGPPDALPPLLLKSHGGPTAAAQPTFEPGIQYWTTRGFVVVDVNYAGSTGYGRQYRDLLRGQWGVRDVEDCLAAAEHLVARGIVDPDRLAIRGGSAGGYTTLCALTFHEVFRAGASYYGIGDLEALARDTHKFEAHYTDWLVGPYPESRALYLARSPIHHSQGLSCPVVFFQGLDDRVVPPSQAEAMAAALAARDIPHAHVTFEGEGHGFRQAANIRTALDGELFFYAQVFGFPVEIQPEAVRMRL